MSGMYYRIQNPAELGTVKALDPNAYNFPKKQKGCKNVCWAVLFFIFFGLFIASGSYGIHYIHFSGVVKKIELTDGTYDVTNFFTALGKIVGVAVLFSTIYAVLAICLVKSCGGQSGGLIKCSIITYVAFTLILCCVNLYIFKLTLINAFFIGIPVGILIFYLIYWWCYWNHIAFADESLKIAMQALQHNPNIVFIPMIFSFLFLISATFFLYSQFVAYIHLGQYAKQDQKNIPLNIVLALLSFVYFWIYFVFTYIVHVTCCAYIAGLLLGEEFRLSLCESFGLACRNIGAISFGSFLLALIQLAKQEAENGMNENNDKDASSFIFYAILYCIACCLEGLLEYVSDYAYVFVAMYENDFMTAAKNSWTLLQYRGLQMVFNDTITSLPGSIFATLGAILGGFVTATFAYYINDMNINDLEKSASKEKEWHMILIFAFILGFVIAKITSNSVFGILESYVKTIFVIFAQHPEVLAAEHPQMYIDLNNAICDKIDTDPQKYKQCQL